MTNEQINIAIAEACGWTDTKIVNEGGKLMYGQTEVPDYCNDLNAMHEAEGVLTIDALTEYRVQLSMLVIAPFRATARQRAEAFLRTINKREGGSDE
jgi:2-phospho-L-lactate transferase/gluconeogenesis factor (CofD/UPF0052 family)